MLVLFIGLELVKKMQRAPPRGMFMTKITGLMTTILLACGLVLAQTDAQSSAAGASQPAAQSATTSSASPSGNSAAPAVAVQNWHGILSDAVCAGGAGTSAPNASQNHSDSEQDKAVDAGRPEKGQKNRVNSGGQCSATASTNMFGLQLNDGKLLKFDAIGNSRAAETLKTKQKWAKELTQGKPIRAKVSGVLSGDTITVTSLD